MRDEAQQVLQFVYDRFFESGGVWPTLRDLQRALNCRRRRSVDAARVVQRIPATLVKPLSSGHGYPAPTEKLILTVEGIERCAGSGEDIENVMTAVKWLAKLVERSAPPRGQSERGLRFTVHQLADAVSLSADKDRKAVARLIAILQAEGWVDD
jgi:hypothetical protein